MQSIIKPLNDKVKVLSSDLANVLRGLQRGDPETKKQVSNLISSVKNIQADFKSTVNSMYASYESSIATMAGLYNPMPMIKIIVFFLQEALAAVQLLTNLMSLVANLVSVSTVLIMLSDSIITAQSWLNKKLLWLTRALSRLKEKGLKYIEWQKRTVSANITLAYLNSSKQATQTILTTLQTKLANTAQDTTSAPNPGINGNYINGIFVYYKTSEVKTQETIIAAVQKKLDEINAEILDKQNELSTYIPNDKTFYKAKWNTEEAQDKQDLITDKPTLNADVSVGA